jgi:FKBP-type peptidyl-prolyl cis-trans isomerase SlyD
MRVAKDTIVSITYVVNDLRANQVEGRQRIEYLHGGYDDVLPLIEAALDGRGVGETVLVELEPVSAYGIYDASMVRVAARSELPQALALGDQYTLYALRSEDELQNAPTDVAIGEIVYRIVDLDASSVVLDGNHPLAGKSVRVTCTVLAIRAATPTDRALRVPRQKNSA